MEEEQKREWAKAQSIELSVDLVTVAKNQLKFLAAVDRNRYLYDGPTLEMAIYRYNAFWLPLLDKHLKNSASEDPLVVPLDCEWIWHCHRLNPVRYKSDCEKRFGRILDNDRIISSVHGTSKSKSEEIWKEMYPHEPYELEYNKSFVGDVSLENFQSEKGFTSYDLVSAVKRQVPFHYQVHRPHVSNDMFLHEALARYKGFLYLIKISKSSKNFVVPTYDIDLMWHSHQLHPSSYCNDLYKLVGKVIEHDDTDSDRTKGSKLDTGFSRTTMKWEDTFGLRYWKAGAMNRGTAPIPVTQIPYSFTNERGKKFHAPNNNYDNLIQFLNMKTMEVLLEFVEIKNIPENHGGELLVSFSKRQPDKYLNGKKTLNISSESGKKHIAIFECEPSGEVLFDLVCHSQSSAPLLNSSCKPLGSCSLSLQECTTSNSRLSIDKWIPVVPITGILTSKPILLHVSLSFTPPTPAPHVFQLRWPQHSVGNVEHMKDRICVTNENGDNILSLQMRDLCNDITKSNVELLKEVQCITRSGETFTLAEFKGSEWSIKDDINCLSTHMLHKNSGNNDGHLFELVGHRLVRLFAGRKLDYEPKHCEKKTSEQDFMTAIEFSTKNPYGRAVAMIDFKHGILNVKDEWMILTSIALAFILFDILKINSNFGTIEAEDISKSVGFWNGGLSAKCSPCTACSGGGGDTAHQYEGGGKCGTKCGLSAKCSPCTACSGGGGDTTHQYEGGGKCGTKCGLSAKCSPCTACSGGGGDTAHQYEGRGKCGTRCGLSAKCSPCTACSGGGGDTVHQYEGCGKYGSRCGLSAKCSPCTACSGGGGDDAA